MTESLPQSPRQNFGTGLFLCILYILVSAGLIDFNKYLMHKERFPFAMALTSFHMAASCILCFTLYLLAPGLYPSMEKTKGQRLHLLKYFIPLGAFFATGLFFSNQAYLYCSVAFLQFMKESNVVLVFTLSCMVGMQVANRSKVAVIFWILAGSTMAVQGELKFVWIGFIVQAISQLGECSKNVLGEWLLSGSNLKLDPLTYTMFMAPVCLAVLMVGNYFFWQPEIIPRMVEWWPYLLPNAVLAFALNVTVSMLIKECSAVGFILAGLVKDIFIVSVSSIAFGDIVTPQQMAGFTLTLGGIFYWSFMRLAPESRLVMGMAKFLGDPLPKKTPPKASSEEKSALLPKKAGNDSRV